MTGTDSRQVNDGKNVVITTNVSITNTMLSIPVGKEVEFSVFDFGIETARTVATYLKKKGKGCFSVTKTSPTTFSVTRLG